MISFREHLKQSSFVITVMLLSLLCFALREARADVKGISYDAAFPTARFPHARYVAGCTTWRLADGHTESWGAVSFSGACQEHDRCYHTLGSAWGECNQRFLQDLRSSCERDLKTAALAESAPADVDDNALQACFSVAELYVARVQDADSFKRYELAQRQEAAYLAYVEGVIDALFKQARGRPATRPEINEALSLLKGDYDLDRLQKTLVSSPKISVSTDP